MQAPGLQEHDPAEDQKKQRPEATGVWKGKRVQQIVRRRIRQLENGEQREEWHRAGGEGERLSAFGEEDRDGEQREVKEALVLRPGGHRGERARSGDVAHIAIPDEEPDGCAGERGERQIGLLGRADHHDSGRRDGGEGRPPASFGDDGDGAAGVEDRDDRGYDPALVAEQVESARDQARQEQRVVLVGPEKNFR